MCEPFSVIVVFEVFDQLWKFTGGQLHSISLGEAQKDVHNAKVYNGFVEGAIPLLSAVTLLSLRTPTVDWDKWARFAYPGCLH
uniref:Uncharacterized protein n=1 Tax=Ditylenchus dipsaci TaxID=166011 RepID=A0A915DRV4_9BILA